MMVSSWTKGGHAELTCFPNYPFRKVWEQLLQPTLVYFVFFSLTDTSYIYCGRFHAGRASLGKYKKVD